MPIGPPLFFCYATYPIGSSPIIGPAVTSASGLLAGLTFNTTGPWAGYITGTITAPIGRYTGGLINGYPLTWYVTPNPNLPVDLTPSLYAPPLYLNIPVGAGITLIGTGGVGPYTFVLDATSPDDLAYNPSPPYGLPPGVTLDPDGAIAGTPTSPGHWQITLWVVDSLGNANLMYYAWDVVVPTIVLDCDSPPGGVVGDAYSHQVILNSVPTSMLGPPFTVTISAGALPGGLGIDNTGLITGTPTTSGVFSFTVHAVGAYGYEASIDCSISILGIFCNNPPDGGVGVPYSHHLPIVGNTPPSAVIVTSGALPPGLSVDNSGLITGTPAATGTSVFTVQVVTS